MRDDKLNKYLCQLYDAGYHSIDGAEPVPEYEVEHLIGLAIQQTPPLLLPKLLIPHDLMDMVAHHITHGHDIDTFAEIMESLVSIMVAEFRPKITQLMADLHARSIPQT